MSFTVDDKLEQKPVQFSEFKSIPLITVAGEISKKYLCIYLCNYRFGYF